MEEPNQSQGSKTRDMPRTINNSNVKGKAKMRN